MSVEALLQAMVAIPSPSGQESTLADHVEALAHTLGEKVHRRGNNVWFELGSGAPRLLVNSHLDTVPPCEDWDTDPFQPVWKGDRLHGLGACPKTSNSPYRPINF